MDSDIKIIRTPSYCLTPKARIEMEEHYRKCNDPQDLEEGLYAVAADSALMDICERMQRRSMELTLIAIFGERELFTYTAQ